MTYLRYQPFNTTNHVLCDGSKNSSGESMCNEYHVHRHHENQDDAAKLLKEILNRNKILINHLKDKYFKDEIKDCLNPEKNNRIDVIHGNELCYKGIELYGYDAPYLIDRIEQLMVKYQENSVYEISPLNKSGSTSYTENKSTLVLCLREKEPNEKGEHDLHDPNTVMFVVVHELAHMMNDKWGHKKQYWKLFKSLLDNAIEAGVYSPVNYKVNPIVYCGLELNYNPLYDDSI